MITEPVAVILVALTDEEARTIGEDDGFVVTRVGSLDELAGDASPEAIVLPLNGPGPLDALRTARAAAPDAAVVVVTDEAHAADGTVAVHAGAEDHLVRDATLPALLPRAVRYAVGMQRIRRELATTEPARVRGDRRAPRAHGRPAREAGRLRVRPARRPRDASANRGPRRSR
jgi:DNA-binding NarL/FixJ family response regulator